MKVLVTGGAGYIGSTICSALLDSGHVPVILDSLVRGCEQFTNGRIFYQGDIGDKDLISKVFDDHPDIQYAVHCAALIVVPESVKDPYSYYRENVNKSLVLFEVLSAKQVKGIIFSSSASIYNKQDSNDFQVEESSPLGPNSPYARTKYMMEMVLQDISAVSSFNAIALRYFNPIGADPKMRSGPFVPNPSHVLGKMMDCAHGKLDQFSITGTEWPTRDGTGIRDYIHVWDIALAHVAALEKIEAVFANKDSSYEVINLGSGRGVTVKELLSAFERVIGRHIPSSEGTARPGDVAGAYASSAKALTLLGWKAEKTTEQAISDALQWAGQFNQ